MRTYHLILLLAVLVPGIVFSQARTNNFVIHEEFTYDWDNGWIGEGHFHLTVNQVRKEYPDGTVEIRYTNNYHDHLTAVNDSSNDTVQSQFVENVTGVFTFGNGSFTNDRHWVTHVVNDPVFGTAHINYFILWDFNPDTGFMEIVDIQNEWSH